MIYMLRHYLINLIHIHSLFQSLRVKKPTIAKPTIVDTTTVVVRSVNLQTQLLDLSMVV